MSRLPVSNVPSSSSWHAPYSSNMIRPSAAHAAGITEATNMSTTQSATTSSAVESDDTTTFSSASDASSSSSSGLSLPTFAGFNISGLPPLPAFVPGSSASTPSSITDSFPFPAGSPSYASSGFSSAIPDGFRYKFKPSFPPLIKCSWLDPNDTENKVNPPTSRTQALLRCRHEQCADFDQQLSEITKTREGVFSLDWNEKTSSKPPSAPELSSSVPAFLSAYGSMPTTSDSFVSGKHTLLLRYINRRVTEEQGVEQGAEQAAKWLLEKLVEDGVDANACNSRGDTVLQLCFKMRVQGFPVSIYLPMFTALIDSESADAQLSSHGAMRNLYDEVVRWPSCEEALRATIRRRGDVDAALCAIYEARKDSTHAIVFALQSLPVDALLKAHVHSSFLLATEAALQHPFHTPTRLFADIMERLLTWQQQHPHQDRSSMETGDSIDSGAVGSVFDFPVWLADLEKQLPVLLCISTYAKTIADGGLWSVTTEVANTISVFNWLNFVERSFSLQENLTDKPMICMLIQASLGKQIVTRMNRLVEMQEETMALRLPDAQPSVHPSAALLSDLLKHICPLIGYEECVPIIRCVLRSVSAAARAAGMDPSRWLAISLDFLFAISGNFSTTLQVASILLEFGIAEDLRGRSITMLMIHRAQPSLLREWFKPQNAHLSMRVGWLGERADVTPVESTLSSSFAAHLSNPVSLHPHLDPSVPCDIWSAVRSPHFSRSFAYDSSRAQFVLQLLEPAIDYHYAETIPKLRAALSEHIVPDLHAVILSFLMPPSTLPDPVAVPSTASEAVSALLEAQPAESELSPQLRVIDHQLRVESIERGFIQRAFEAERRLWAVARST